MYYRLEYTADIQKNIHEEILVWARVFISSVDPPGVYVPSDMLKLEVYISNSSCFSLSYEWSFLEWGIGICFVIVPFLRGDSTRKEDLYNTFLLYMEQLFAVIGTFTIISTWRFFFSFKEKLQRKRIFHPSMSPSSKQTRNESGSISLIFLHFSPSTRQFFEKFILSPRS